MASLWFSIIKVVNAT